MLYKTTRSYLMDFIKTMNVQCSNGYYYSPALASASVFVRVSTVRHFLISFSFLSYGFRVFILLPQISIIYLL